MPGRNERLPAIGQAPGDLATLQSFVNTLDIEQSTDELADPGALLSWLRQTGLAAHSAVGSDDLADALALREALRSVLRSHVTHGARTHGLDQDAVSELRRISAQLPTRLEVSADGQLRAAASGSGVRAALARILLIAAESATMGTWARLKVCSADDCQWAFYDRSPTRNGCWCSMQVCGSRAKSLAYRQRAAAAGPAARASRSARTAAQGA